MPPLVLALIVALLLLVVSFGAGRKLLFTHPMLLSGKQKGLRFVLGLAAGLGLFILVGSFFYLPAGGEEPASPQVAEADREAASEAVELHWHTNFQAALAEAKESGKPILVDCWASWCKPCKKLYKNILTAPALNDRMSRFVLVKLDTMDEANEGFVEQYGVGDNLPWIGFFKADGTFLEEEVLFGDKAAGPFSAKASFGAILNRLGPAPETAAQEGWLTDLKEGFARAKAENKPLLVDGWAVWCTSCLELKKVTFQDPEVKAALEEWVKVEIDMDADENQWVWDAYGIRGLPWVVRFEPGETENPTWMLAGYEPPDQFTARLSAAEVTDDSVAGWLASKGLFLTLLLVFVAGILASLTPCAYPTYLLIFGFFSSDDEGEQKSIWFGVLVAALIVFGMAVSYSAAGIAAALGGGAVGRIMQNPWVMGAIALLFVGIGSSSLGVLPQMEFQGIKTVIQSRQQSTMLWAFIFGLVMGLVVAPCVGPVLIGVLTYIAAEGDLLLGVGLMSTFALGMGVLFFAMAIFSHAIRTRLRMGKWNEFITVLFGVIFYAAALYYLKGVLPFEKLFGLFQV